MGLIHPRQGFLTLCTASLLALGTSLRADEAPEPAGGRVNAFVNDAGFGGFGGLAGGNPFAPAMGGGANADFDSLIDLITSTVASESWMENGTGEGDISPFPNGVWIDPAGGLHVDEGPGNRASLAAVRTQGRQAPPDARAAAPPDAARRASQLRYVSLPRLEAAIAQRLAAGRPLDAAMLTLAGLQRIQYVLVYPETGDLVLAGPAGDWRLLRGGGLASADQLRPLVRLDDLLSLWRRWHAERAAGFGCSIVPRQESLARTQQFLAASAAQPLEPGQRSAWLEQLQTTLGDQDVEFYNVSPDSRIAGVLLAADYHMKLVGMGLAEGVPGVKSYLATVRLGPGGQAPAMSVLRWWFAMPPAKVAAADEGCAFALPEHCVQVLSENQMLAEQGQRIPTGASDELTSRFAASFTAEFAALADRYPIYGQLARVFELSLALALIEREHLAAKVGWQPTLLLDSQHLRMPVVATPRNLASVINHRVIGGRHIIAGVSGGVWLDGRQRLAIAPADSAAAVQLDAVRQPQPAPSADDAGDVAWWWDAAP